MKKIITIPIAFIGIIVLLLICGINGDKSELLNWLHTFSKYNTEAYFCSDYMNAEKALSAEDVQTLISVFKEIDSEKLNENKELAGITPEYGLRLVVNDECYYINQADAPKGQSEISFLNKQWWIESEKLEDFMRSFLEDQQ
jgi:hypothetical protein